MFIVKTACQPKLAVNEEEIENVTNMKYLGTILNNNKDY